MKLTKNHAWHFIRRKNGRDILRDGTKAPKDGAYTDQHGPRTEYKVGEIVKSDKWDENWMNECSNGIYFFITREEAEAY